MEDMEDDRLSSAADERKAKPNQICSEFGNLVPSNAISIFTFTISDKEKKDARELHSARDRPSAMLHLPQDCDWEEEALQVLQVSRHHLLRQGMPGEIRVHNMCTVNKTCF